MRALETILWQFDPETGETVSRVLYPEEDGYIPNSSQPMIFGDFGSVSLGTDYSAVKYIPNDRHLLYYAPDGSREKTVSVAAVYPGGLPMDAYDYRSVIPPAFQMIKGEHQKKEPRPVRFL